ncbi:VacJ family lipoprotein [Azoarcus sp. L1K30]|uniref:MlaA family lipoprotein n=1 Tax=Azoarcus sp. L1K30 TaxID=2820277 RepID=UPI001B813D53|nr:VacJ family lipoprotein [Azoarcus sp. L1K30]MBR0568314.1 VacJ family lipoprotein [Azoarcus sp. L1K30]
MRGEMRSCGSRARTVLLAAFVLVLGSGCATTASNPQDPLEGYNRAMFSFNEGVDKVLIKPAAQAYETVLPSPVRTGVSNVFGNLGDPWVGLNNLLQGKFADALSDMMRFLFNSTFGFVGWVDIASEMGFPKHDEDFGQTLGRWGVGEGAYVVLPILGPRTLRDAAALPADMAGDIVNGVGDIPTRNTLTGLRIVNTRANLLGIDKTLSEGTLDKYSYVRDFYLEQRRYKVFDGNPPRVYEDFSRAGQDSLRLGSAVDELAAASLEGLELLGVGGLASIAGADESVN